MIISGDVGTLAPQNTNFATAAADIPGASDTVVAPSSDAANTGNANSNSSGSQSQAGAGQPSANAAPVGQKDDARSAATREPKPEARDSSRDTSQTFDRETRPSEPTAEAVVNSMLEAASIEKQAEARADQVQDQIKVQKFVEAAQNVQPAKAANASGTSEADKNEAEKLPV